MTAWITLFALTVLFALALRHGRSKELPMPPGYDGERQLAELHALIAARSPFGCTDLSGCRASHWAADSAGSVGISPPPIVL